MIPPKDWTPFRAGEWVARTDGGMLVAQRLPSAKLGSVSKDLEERILRWLTYEPSEECLLPIATVSCKLGKDSKFNPSWEPDDPLRTAHQKHVIVAFGAPYDRRRLAYAVTYMYEPGARLRTAALPEGSHKILRLRTTSDDTQVALVHQLWPQGFDLETAPRLL